MYALINITLYLLLSAMTQQNKQNILKLYYIFYNYKEEYCRPFCLFIVVACSLLFLALIRSHPSLLEGGGYRY